MSYLRLAAMVSALLLSHTTLAQRWVPISVVEDGFLIMAPGEFEVEEIDYETEYGIVVPARIYRHENDSGVYTVTVVDYSDSQQLHAQQEQPLLSVYGQVDVRGSVAFAASKIRERAESVDYDAYHYISRVDGHQLHTTNPDGTRTLAGLYLLESRLYVIEATTNPGTPPGGMFQQSLQFIDENGEVRRFGGFESVIKVLGRNRALMSNTGFRRMKCD